MVRTNESQRSTYFGRIISLQNGTQIRFWEDTWIGDKPLGMTYSALYNLVKKRNVTIANVLRTRPLNVASRRALVGENLKNCYKIVAIVAFINLTSNKDVFRWDLNKDGTFTVKSMYLAIIQDGVVSSKIPLWKIKVPLKIKIFSLVSSKRGYSHQR